MELRTGKRLMYCLADGQLGFRPVGQWTRQEVNGDNKSKNHGVASRCSVAARMLVIRLQMGSICAHRVTEVAINKFLPHFGDVVVVHQALKKPPSFENRASLVSA